MERRTGFALILAVATVLASAVFSASGSPIGGVVVDWLPVHRSGCSGSIGECLDGDEFALDSESTRRMLSTAGYISYGALKRNTVPCSVRGASYYNCRPGAQANPYTRGCSRIALCRS